MFSSVVVFKLQRYWFIQYEFTVSKKLFIAKKKARDCARAFL